MHFDKDLFISYAHIDNQPLMEGQQGWVERFHYSLATFLNMRMGGKTNIWRDDALKPDDYFSPEILAQFPQTAILLSVLSQRYIESKWCTTEVEKFCEAAEKSLGVRVENKCRVVKVLKDPVDRALLPHPVMRETLGYQFYDMGTDQVPVPYDSNFGPELGQKFLTTVNKLAFDLSELLKMLSKAEAGEKADDAPAKPTVYLAECSYDQYPAREALEAELKRHGYQVLPDNEMSMDEATYRTQVAENLAKCQLSIHLVGSAYGAIPNGPSEKSIVVLQNELAIMCSHEHGLKRILWIPEGLAPKQDAQMQFIHMLETDAAAQFGADLITASQQEVFKSAILAALVKLENPPVVTPKPMVGEGRKLVYLICDERDRMSTVPLRKVLKAHGMDVEIPVFEGDAATVRQANQDLMTQASGMIVYYGAGGELWKVSVDGELRKANGLNRAKPVFICLAAPETDAKKELMALEDDQLLNCMGEFSDACVQAFLRAMEDS
jgi:hypothetical protein